MEKHVEFLNKAKTDKAIQEKIKAAKNASKEEMTAGIIKVAKEAGYDLNPEDLKKAYTHVKGELSDTELEAVSAAGGSRGSCNTGYAPLY